MDLNKMNEDWQKDAPILAAMEKTNPFTVPDGYFERLATQINPQISVLKFDNGKDIFEIPEGYFETLSDTIDSRIKLEHLKTAQAFTLPENYFPDLENRIKAKIDIPKERTAIVRNMTRNWASYAAAACVTVALAVGLYFNTGRNDINKQLAEVPSEEIVNYLQVYSDAGDAPALIENLGDEPELSDLGLDISDQDIEQYLNSNL